ncbi:MAG: sigma-70 family RNA polymerase sigma factor [Eubacteriales bacterium]|jgi:RNA polymerase sigma factor (sigma-70 family)|nr:sigma-70 family RNA polymerase sigma factor [Clostridiales bacterium]
MKLNDLQEHGHKIGREHDIDNNIAEKSNADCAVNTNEGDVYLLRAAAKGDADAFSTLVRRYEKYVYNIAYMSLRDKQDALDVSQETFIKLWRFASAYRGDCSVSSWIFRITRNNCADFARKRHGKTTISLTQRQDDDDDRETEIPEDDITSLPECEVERRELAHAVRAAIMRLPDDHREVIILRDLNQLTYAEIADVLGINEGTVKSRLSRARQNLKKLLEDGTFRNYITSNNMSE